MAYNAPPPSIADSYKYILYVHPKDKHSLTAIELVNWGVNNLSADGEIKYQDIREVRREYGAIPPYLTHVPTLINVDERVQWRGSECIAKLSEWREKWTTHSKTTTVYKTITSGRNVEVGAAPDLDSPVVLPPDPRDNFSAPAAEAAPVVSSVPSITELFEEEQARTVTLQAGARSNRRQVR